MHALFNFDQTYSQHALIRACTLIHFSGFLKDFCQMFRPNAKAIYPLFMKRRSLHKKGIDYLSINLQKLGLFSGKFCLLGSLVTSIFHFE